MPAEKLDLAKDSTMTKAARVLADAVRKNAPHAGIRKSVRIGRREGRADSNYKVITVLVGKPYVPGSGEQGSEFAAKAFDTGSGIHAQAKGGTYKIKAVNYQNLVFFWYRNANWFVGKEVDHPGVAGTGYMKKSADEARPQMRKIIMGDAKETIRLRLLADFRNFGK